MNESAWVVVVVFGCHLLQPQQDPRYACIKKYFVLVSQMGAIIFELEFLITHVCGDIFRCTSVERLKEVNNPSLFRYEKFLFDFAVNAIMVQMVL